VADFSATGHRVAAVVPTWNEVASIAAVVRDLRRAGACCVFVVDGGSTDGTQEVALAAGARLVEEGRPGYGRACLSGTQAAQTEKAHGLIAFLDGDGSCDPADLPRLVDAARDADLVLGRRVVVASGALPWHARLGNRMVAALLTLRSGKPVHDLPPFKLARAWVLAALALDDEGYGWTAQLVGRGLAHPALRVVETPTTFRPRAGGVSKVSGRLGPSLHAARGMLERSWTATRPRGALVLMAKAPRAGHSKTRLELELGTVLATSFWSACLRDSGERLRRAADQAGVDVIAMTPSAEDATAVRAITGLPSLVQKRPGLGAALLEVSELRVPFTVAVSADTPALPVERLLQAVDVARAGKPVLGPGLDGGYYLVGLPRRFDRGRSVRAFLGNSLGGDGALAQARAALGEVELLEPWADVDTAAELEALAEQLCGEPDLAPAVAAWLDGPWQARAALAPGARAAPQQ
jgi:glycosyltransferase A (GT-A) superfamily protein (DUF2064 family)